MLGALLLTVGTLTASLGNPSGVVALVATSLRSMITGGFYVFAGRGLRAVLQTSSSDEPHTIAGLTRLRNAFRFDATVSCGAMLLGFIGPVVWPI